MKKSEKNKEIIFTVKTETVKDFFARGKQVAAMLDKGEKIAPQKIISFEDSNDLIKFISKTRLMLLAAIRKSPDSISHLAHRLHRSRSAIDKDVQLLEEVGIVKSEYMANPGHGRCRIIRAADSKPIRLQVETVI